MKKSSKRICVFLVLFAVVALFSILSATAAVSCTPQAYTTHDESIQIEAKYKKISTYKITFDANGGKIGTKKTAVISVKKGSKIGKLPTPKLSGYQLKGWYTKK